MKDKEKQIEEIKQIINERCEAELEQVHASSKGGKVIKTVDTILIAKDIYNAGYRKLPENARIFIPDGQIVLLTREEFEVLKIKEKHWLETCISIWKNAKIDGSKETAEKILNELYCTPKEQVENKIKELARFIGVEIKE